MACADVDMDIDENEGTPGRSPREPPMVRQYRALELLPEKKGPLHDLLQKKPASLLMVSGLLSVGVGIVFAVTQEMQESLINLFRLSHLTGALVSLMVNLGCIIVAVVSACLISVDLALWRTEHDTHLRMEVLELCVLALEVLLSTILCIWFSKETRAKSTSS
ncbi:hypothetical protein F7725_018554 [Dissostichus mawsoni]|uniref:Uncharacterized protein n=1 Tax=Dissostichus mawsoni TaxID=36200 RepID=A0A7J5XTC8_DISMA|nr:hypothetical protein F7725_018554 [Dissostichus mawsoni]